MRVLVCGSRSWTSVEQTKTLYKVLDRLSPTHIMSGGAKGADYLAEVYAKSNAIPITILTPNYKRDGKSAPLKRNDWLLDRNPDLVVAFWDGVSTGTKYTIDGAHKRFLNVKVVLDGGLEGQSDPSD